MKHFRSASKQQFVRKGVRGTSSFTAEFWMRQNVTLRHFSSTPWLASPVTHGRQMPWVCSITPGAAFRGILSKRQACVEKVQTPGSLRHSLTWAFFMRWAVASLKIGGKQQNGMPKLEMQDTPMVMLLSACFT